MRWKALFLIKIIVLSTVFLAQNISAQENLNLACCEVTVDGDYCRYTKENNCAPGGNAFTRCAETSYCSLGCSISDDGACFKNSPKAYADNNDLTWIDDASCDVPQCQRGCCVLGTEYAFVTQAQCVAESSDFPGAVDFREYITDEQSCLAEAIKEEEGCCVIDQNTCNYGTRGQCLDLADASSFKQDSFCSDPQLGCECSAHSSKGCDGEDIYWFDSCGNREEKAEDCDYTEGNICGQVGNDFACISVNCEQTKTYPFSPQSGKSRFNGESWCIYDDDFDTGFDTVGSRQYKASCVLGKEVIEECSDFRQEFCVSGEKIGPTGARFSEAICKQNNYKGCSSCKTDSCCESELRDCRWLSDKGSVGDDELACVPLVPPGNKFWSDGGASQCSLGAATFNCEKGGNCEALTLQKAEICNSLGDCGDFFNFAGEYSDDGFESSYTVIRDKEDYWDSLKRVGKKYKFALALLPFYSKVGGYLGGGLKQTFKPSSVPGGAFRNPPIATDINGNEFTYGGKDKTGNHIWNDAKDNRAKNIEFSADPKVSSLELDPNDLANTDLDVKQGKVSAAKTTQTLVTVATIAFIVYTLWEAYEDRKGEIRSESVSCDVWVPPAGGDKCDICNNLLDGIPCTEYKCRSLGAACEFLNPNTGNETCVYVNPKDASSPIIGANEEVLSDGFTLTERVFPGGFEGFEVNEIVPSHQALRVGIVTDEAAICKLGIEPGIEFDDMLNVRFVSLIEEGLFVFDHNILLNLPAQESDTYQLYVRCQDKNGNANRKDYFIVYRVDQGPDLTAPRIEGASLSNNIRIPFNLSSTPFSIYTNEAGQCKYDVNNIDYDNMASSFSCSNEITSLGYKCDTVLEFEKDVETEFYVRCRDEQGNTNVDSDIYKIIPSNFLAIDSIEPEGEILNDEPVLKVKTGGGAFDDGIAVCGYSSSGVEDTFIEFIKTNSDVHEQKLGPLAKKDYTYHIECIDLANNVVTGSTSFSVTVDNLPPDIISIYRDDSTAVSLLKIVTNEDSICEYSTEGRFAFGIGNRMVGEGVEHSLNVVEDVYYVRCQDASLNTMPAVAIYL